jgi:hypothetical protein
MRTVSRLHKPWSTKSKIELKDVSRVRGMPLGKIFGHVRIIETATHQALALLQKISSVPSPLVIPLE